MNTISETAREIYLNSYKFQSMYTEDEMFKRFGVEDTSDFNYRLTQFINGKISGNAKVVSVFVTCIIKLHEPESGLMVGVQVGYKKQVKGGKKVHTIGMDVDCNHAVPGYAFNLYKLELSY
jgi:hypothetical protein